MRHASSARRAAKKVPKAAASIFTGRRNWSQRWATDSGRHLEREFNSGRKDHHWKAEVDKVRNSSSGRRKGLLI